MTAVTVHVLKKIAYSGALPNNAVLYLFMRTLLFLFIVMLAAEMAQAQDFLITKKNIRINCLIEDVKDYSIVFRTSNNGRLITLEMNALQSISIKDSSKREALASRSSAIRALLNTSDSTMLSQLDTTAQNTLAAELLQSGGKRIRKAASLMITGNVIAFGSTLFVILPAVAASPVAIPILLVGNTLGLVFTIQGLYELQTAGREISGSAAAW